MSQSTKIGNMKKDLGKGPTQRLEDTLSAKKNIRLTLQSTIKSSV